MCAILVNRLEDLACPVNVWLGKLTALDMTPLGWLGRKSSTQTKEWSLGDTDWSLFKHLESMGTKRKELQKSFRNHWTDFSMIYSLFTTPSPYPHPPLFSMEIRGYCDGLIPSVCPFVHQSVCYSIPYCSKGGISTRFCSIPPSYGSMGGQVISTPNFGSWGLDSNPTRGRLSSFHCLSMT